MAIEPGFKDRAYNYYLTLGHSPQAAAALTANALHESVGGNPTQQQIGGGPGRGLFQWNANDRYKQLETYARDRGLDPNSEIAQLHFSDYELTGGDEQAAGRKLAAAQSYPQAQDAVMGYLRPRGYNPNNPSASDAYPQRYNQGADLAGVSPIAGGGAPASGLLQDADLAGYNNPTGTAVQPQSAGTVGGEGAGVDNKMLGAASSELTKGGLGLLAASQAKPDTTPVLQAQAHMPDAAGIPLPNYTRPPGQPDFQQMLMQQRLMRRR